MTYRQKLTPFTITKIRQPGRHTDGEGLALVVATDGSKRWVLRYRAPADGRVRDMGLGPLRTVDLFAAREQAKTGRALVTRGVDPLDARAAEPTFAPTLASVLDDFIKALAPTGHCLNRSTGRGLDQEAEDARRRGGKLVELTNRLHEAKSKHDPDSESGSEQDRAE